MLLPRRLGVSDGTRPSGLSQQGLNSKGSDNPAAATTVRPALCNPSTAHTNKQLDVRMERSTLVDDKKKSWKCVGINPNSMFRYGDHHHHQDNNQLKWKSFSLCYLCCILFCFYTPISNLGILYCQMKQVVMTTDSRKKTTMPSLVHFTFIASFLNADQKPTRTHMYSWSSLGTAWKTVAALMNERNAGQERVHPHPQWYLSDLKNNNNKYKWTENNKVYAGGPSVHLSTLSEQHMPQRVIALTDQHVLQLILSCCWFEAVDNVLR